MADIKIELMGSASRLALAFAKRAEAALASTQAAATQALTDIAAAKSDAIAAIADDKDAAATAANDAAISAAFVAAGGNIYDTYALAVAALANIADNAVVLVLSDETRGGRKAFYRKSAVALVFKRLFNDGPSTFFIDPVNGSDAAVGSSAAPWKTLSHADTVSLPGDRWLVRGLYPVIKESNVVGGYGDLTFVTPVTIEPETSGATIIFQGYDAVALGSWSAVGTDPVTNTAFPSLYKATIAHQWGGLTGKGDGNRGYPGLIYKGNPLVEIKLGTTAGTFQYTTRAACLAAVQALPGSFFQEDASGNGSRYDLGFQKGNFTYYANFASEGPWGTFNGNVAGAGGEDPGTAAGVGQRSMPTTAVGSIVRNCLFFGGVGHNGTRAYFSRLENCTAAYFRAHGFFTAGGMLVDCLVIGADVTSATSYGYHYFNSTAQNVEKTIYLRCGARDCTGTFFSMFGGHGGTTDTTPIIGEVEYNDCWAQNITGILGGSLSKYGHIVRRFRGRGIGSSGGGSYLDSAGSIDWIDCDIVFSPYRQGGVTTAPSGWALSEGMTVNVYGGRSAAIGGKWLKGGATSAVLNIFDHVGLMQDGATSAAKGIYITSGSPTINVKRSILQYYGQSQVGSGLQIASTAGATFNFTDSLLSGISLGANGTYNLVRTPKNGKGGLYPDNDGGVVMGEDCPFWTLGVVAQGLTAQGAVQYPAMLTTTGVIALAPSAVTHALPAGTYNCVSVVTSGGQPYYVIAGNGCLAYKAYNASAATAWTVVDMTGYTGIQYNWIVGGGTDGIIWLLGNDGSILKYTIGGALVAITNPLMTGGTAYPLTGGYRNGTTVIVFGGVGSDGSMAGTAGGALISTDTGATFANSVASTDNYILVNTASGGAAIGTSAYRIKCGGYCNGVYFLAGTNGLMLTSSTGAAGTWRSLATKVNAQFLWAAADTTNNQMWFGAIGAGSNITAGLQSVPQSSIHRVDCSSKTATVVAGTGGASSTTLTIAQLINGSVGAGTINGSGVTAAAIAMTGTSVGGLGTVTLPAAQTIPTGTVMTVTAAAPHPAALTVQSYRNPMGSLAAIGFAASWQYGSGSGQAVFITDNFGKVMHTEANASDVNWKMVFQPQIDTTKALSKAPIHTPPLQIAADAI